MKTTTTVTTMNVEINYTVYIEDGTVEKQLKVRQDLIASIKEMLNSQDCDFSVVQVDFT